MIMIFGTLVENDDIFRHFFHFFKILIFWAVRGVGGGGWGVVGGVKRAKNGPKWKISLVCHAPYLRNHTSYDCHLQYTCVK